MRRRDSSADEIQRGLDQALAQAAHLVERGRDAFLADDLDGALNRLAGERLIITVQAVLDDLPASFVDAHQDLPFDLVRGMRNRLAHGYDDIDAAIVWATLEDRLPEFVRSVLARLPRD